MHSHDRSILDPLVIRPLTMLLNLFAEHLHGLPQAMALCQPCQRLLAVLDVSSLVCMDKVAVYSSNHEAHHSQGPELIDHRHIHLTWESNFFIYVNVYILSFDQIHTQWWNHSRYSVVPPLWPVWIAPWCNCKACHESAQHLVFECACSCHTLWFEPPSHTCQTYSLWNAGSTSAFTGKTSHQLLTKRTHWAYSCWIWLHGQKLSSAGKQKYSL